MTDILDGLHYIHKSGGRIGYLYIYSRVYSLRYQAGKSILRKNWRRND